MKLEKLGLAVLAASALAGPAIAQQTPDGAPADWPEPVMDQQVFTFFMAERNEYQIDDDNQFYVWDAQAWIGGDYNKLWLKTEGEYVLDQGTLESADWKSSTAAPSPRSGTPRSASARHSSRPRRGMG